MTVSTRLHWSRRAIIESGLLAGVAAALPLRVRAADGTATAGAQAKLPLITKAIPSTGERVPVIGIGTNAFREADYLALRDVLQRMQEMGGTVIDTAAGYGDSEAVIGHALADLNLRGRMFIATKFNAQGPNAHPGEVFGQASFDRSLERLRTDHVDVMFVHDIDSVDPLMPLLQDLKKARKARYIGITTFRTEQQAEVAEKMQRYAMDFVQVNYSIANREAEKTIFPLAMERKIAVMVDVPLGGRRGSLLEEAGNRPLPPWAADIDVTSWSQFFLKYTISHPAVTCVIPGATKVEHLVDNQLAGHGRLPDAAMRKKMEQYWESKA